MTVDRSVEVREVDAVDELRAIEALFVSVWRTPSDQPPINADILRGLAHTGCYVAGAYDRGRLLGASAGFLGGKSGDVHLHSHITGVAPEAQGRHIGQLLKLHQRDWCLERGIEVVTWTFDPLIRRNGWFNLHRLGADIVGFERDFYGEMRDGVNVGDHSDRCLVRWNLPAAAARDALAPADTVSALGVDAHGAPVASPTDAGARRCAVPEDFEAVRRDNPDQAREWRRAFREAFGAAIDDGLGVVGMTAAGEYVLRRP